ncbi:MAG TPA: metal-dependent transcriptional regulator [Acidobacteriaceae bacterium]|nr:metal-dependent transcriptional regulator [Acidobacteriaceae bacterium]
MPTRARLQPNTESVDNYLKAILALGGQQERLVTGKELALHLHVAPASVTNMLQKLAAQPEPPVLYEIHRGARLSVAGKRRALEVVRHHRLLETFLFEVLHYPLEEVHDEAERLEHFISERFEERIAARLGHPKIDPHGHCIPELDGRMANLDAVPLSDTAGNGPFLVESVEDRDSHILRLLRTSGIRPGARLQVRTRTAVGHLRVTLRGRTVHLPPQHARAVRVRPARSPHIR